MKERYKEVGRISYLPPGTKAYGLTLGPVILEGRNPYRYAVIETIPVELIRDLLQGQIGSFLIWDESEEGGA